MVGWEAEVGMAEEGWGEGEETGQRGIVASVVTGVDVG